MATRSPEKIVRTFDIRLADFGGDFRRAARGMRARGHRKLQSGAWSSGRGASRSEYPARMVGALSGQITVGLPGDGSCTGAWSLRGKQQQSFDLSADWDLIYGAGYRSAHVLGVREFVRTTLSCTGGSNLRMEMSNETNTRGHTRGVAEDDHGNVFKVSVYN
jgi:hypothetical protein